MEIGIIVILLALLIMCVVHILRESVVIDEKNRVIIRLGERVKLLENQRKDLLKDVANLEIQKREKIKTNKYQNIMREKL